MPKAEPHDAMSSILDEETEYSQSGFSTICLLVIQKESTELLVPRVHGRTVGIPRDILTRYLTSRVEIDCRIHECRLNPKKSTFLFRIYDQIK